MEISDVKTALDDAATVIRDTVGTIKASEAQIAEVTARNENAKRALAKVLRSASAEVRKILSTMA